MAYELTKNDWKLVGLTFEAIERIAETAIGLSIVKSDMKPMYKLMALGAVGGGFKRLKIIRRGALHDAQAKRGNVQDKCVRNPVKERQETSNEEPDAIPKRVMNRIGF